MSNKLKIAFLTADDPENHKSWSGIYYYMFKSLKSEFSEVVKLGPYRPSLFSKYLQKVLIKICELYHKIFFNSSYNASNGNIVSWFQGHFFDKKLSLIKPDVIFAPTASVQIASLKSKIPICYFSDATYSRMINYYESFNRYSEKSQQISNDLEYRAIQKSISQVYPSNWALESAKNDYGASNPHIVKMGANIESDIIINIEKNYDSTIHILFVGVDWIRKGGDIVLETIDILAKKGFDIQLTVCGCTPPLKHPKMEVIPFIDKNNPIEMQKFISLFKDSHLFFMPTRAECYGIVFCEANAYGLPVISTTTGGVSSIIEDGVNGFLLSISSKPNDYAEIIEGLLIDKVKFKEMSETSILKYKKELNWQSWAQKMNEILTFTYETGKNKN